MNFITKKTNVRQHNRHTKNRVADVKRHERRVRKQVVAVIPLKGMRYKEAKAIFPNLNPRGDYDGDGVPNKRDCRPFDEERQDDNMQSFIDSIDVSDEDVRMAGEAYEDEKRYGDKPENEGGVFTTPQKELEESSWDILNKKRKNRVPFNDEGYEDFKNNEENYWGGRWKNRI